MKKKNRWTEGNQVQLLEGGDQYFPSLIEAIQSAKSEILFQAYIFYESKIGSSISQALIEAARRGISVHMALDGFGSGLLSGHSIDQLKASGIRLVIFKPLPQVFRLGFEFLRRLHRKIVIVDARTAYIGGMNIADDQLLSYGARSRLDFAAKIQGPLVQRMHHRCRLFHARMEWQWKDFFSQIQEDPPDQEDNASAIGSARAAFVVRDNFRNRRLIEKHYRIAIQKAEREIIIANAYFFPGYRFLRLLRKIRKTKQISIKLVLQGTPEYWILKIATEALYRGLLKAGIEIYEYQPRLLHAKVAVVDESWATIGSCNLDPLSLFFNLEANVLIQDQNFCGTLAARLHEIIANDCVRIQPSHKAPFFRRILSWIAFFFFRYGPVLLNPSSGAMGRVIRRKNANPDLQKP